MRKNSGTDQTTSAAAAPVPRYRGMLSQERKNNESNNTAPTTTPKQRKSVTDKKATPDLAILGSGSSTKMTPNSGNQKGGSGSVTAKVASFRESSSRSGLASGTTRHKGSVASASTASLRVGKDQENTSAI